MKDSWLSPYLSVIQRRRSYIESRLARLTDNGAASLYDRADYHLRYGLHTTRSGWIFREWAPNAGSVNIIGDRTGWEIDPAFELDRVDEDGTWEKTFPRHCFQHRDLYRLNLSWEGGQGDRMPSAATRLVQDPETLIFNAQVWQPDTPYTWRNASPAETREPLLVYEAHVGMALEEERVGTFREFAESILPRIKQAGYTSLQLMAVQEHPYYASFGYHVTGFFAPSSRFGTPDDFRYLVDEAHGLGIKVLIDLVHSHAAKNEVEGITRFDGTRTQFFLPGERGIHPLWDSCCFDYEKTGVLRFLLSNCRYWMEEFRVDGFRFDGVTSMVFTDHGLNRAFTSYADYFTEGIDVDALGYLTFANRLIHGIRTDAVTIAEDVSGYPGMASPEDEGGMGFDYRFAMGVPDFWIRLLKEFDDEAWPLEHLWHELNSRRDDEKSISYAESHDQALVGDQTLMMRLMGSDIYTRMRVSDNAMSAFRGVSLHKLIRLITLACAGHGYLTFMGNEFGHPEWIDFPTQQNGWSYHYARRQWSLADNSELYFAALARFDRAMLDLVRNRPVLGTPKPALRHLHQDDKVIAFERGRLVFLFNFHPARSFPDYGIPLPEPGSFKMVLDSDAQAFGGKSRLVPDQIYFTSPVNGLTGIDHHLSVYLPSRTGIVLERRAS